MLFHEILIWLFNRRNFGVISNFLSHPHRNKSSRCTNIRWAEIITRIALGHVYEHWKLKKTCSFTQQRKNLQVSPKSQSNEDEKLKISICAVNYSSTISSVGNKTNTFEWPISSFWWSAIRRTNSSVHCYWLSNLSLATSLILFCSNLEFVVSLNFRSTRGRKSSFVRFFLLLSHYLCLEYLNEIDDDDDRTISNYLNNRDENRDLDFIFYHHKNNKSNKNYRHDFRPIIIQSEQLVISREWIKNLLMKSINVLMIIFDLFHLKVMLSLRFWLLL